ncbi:hypothetical protein N799_12325 [Lysobacter arseniciresistens ZS79]|uniref:Lipoprotein n=1 Tax=Lysobacter arseniciresistens ZS79 TaxID=913325 RepID=A0A0A0F372_9GAMM|nr:hypothetical protein [Lysobacter arseniciresistens]KGM56985.1 hypothetical protein N799_12325 [Lysobacter arseniciresistens ZS79]
MDHRIAIACAAALLSLSITACDRRELEPVEPADSATTVIDETPTPAPGGDVDPTIDPCFGLTGQAETDCRATHDEAAPPESADNPVPVGD